MITAGIGMYILAGPGGMDTWKPNELMKAIYDPSDGRSITANRRFAHVIAGTSIVALTLLLAAIGRWAPRRRGLLFVFALLLLFALGAQLWLGGLLLVDGVSGQITKLN